MTDYKLKQLRTRISSVFLVGSVFFYFLIFAQFAFLHRLQELNGPEFLAELALLAMGVGGILGCIITARFFKYRNAKSWLMGSFIACGLVATIVATNTRAPVNISAGFGLGLSLGILTVSVVPIISKTFPAKRLGLWTALGVGGAYALCNVPWIFSSSPVDHCIFAAIACVVGVTISNYLPGMSRFTQAEAPLYRNSRKSLYSRSGLAIVVALFLVLIWMDSAVFTIIQETAQVKAAVWSGTAQLWKLASIHFLTAIVAGWLLDKGWFLQSMAGAVGLMMFEAWGLSHWTDFANSLSTYLYITAVSGYSTGLVAYAALYPEKRNLPGIAVRAAWVFAVSGWIGSGMGIGMARDLQTVPGYFLLVAFALTLISLIRVRSIEDQGRAAPNPLHQG